MSGDGLCSPKEIPKLRLWGRALRLRTWGAGLPKGFPSARTVQWAESPGHPWGRAVRTGFVRAGCGGAHLAVGCANAGHLLVEFIQLSLELLQLLPLDAHALVVLAAGGRLAQCA